MGWVRLLSPPPLRGRAREGGEQKRMPSIPLRAPAARVVPLKGGAKMLAA